MSDRYVHLFPFNRWDERQSNLVALGRHLALNAPAISAAGGLAFGTEMAGLPSPETLEAEPVGRLPPLAHGPDAGLLVEPGEAWPAYWQRVFGIYEHRPAMVWLQSAMWLKTDPSPAGAALRIAYLLDYGVPHDHVEIAMGQAYTDYDTNGFLWEKLGLSPLDLPAEDRPSRRGNQPKWVGAPELARRRAEVKEDFRLPPEETPFSAGLPIERVRARAERSGPLPGVFNDFLLFSGRRTPLGHAAAYADRLDAIHQFAVARIWSAAREQDDPVPEDAIFIGLKYDRHPEFILCGPRNDSPVFMFDADSGRVTQTGISIFNWIEEFMRGAAPPPNSSAASEPMNAEKSGNDSIRQSLLRLLARLRR